VKKKLLALAAVFLGYAVFENTIALTVRREKISDGSGNTLKVAHIADLHKKRFGRGNVRLCERVKAESPDMIIISGDIVSRTQKDLSAVRSALEQFCRIAPVYMIFGNHEQSLPEEKRRELLRAIAESGAVLLRNDSISVNIRGRSMNIHGLEPSYSTYKKNDSYRDLDVITLADMERLLGKCPEGENLLIAHNPFFGEVYAEWGADYIMSGHIHGGAVRIFGVGLLSPERRFFPKNSKGIYTIGKAKLLVSAGLGKLRLFNPPEIVTYEL